MKVAEILENRRRNWHALERLCDEMENRHKKSLGAASVSRFAELYRAACADLALADSYRLPQNTVHYLHRLVGRAHNQLYRSRVFDYSTWGRMLLLEVPRRIFHDRCVQLVFCLFWGVFIVSACLAAAPQVWPDYAEQVLSADLITMMETSFQDPLGGRNSAVNSMMASFYIYNNTGIGLKCFAGGLLVIPGILMTLFNAAFLGAAFGYMARPDVPQGVNFFEFVTAHGPFELTAIVLSAGAGLRLGMSWLNTEGLTRVSSLRKTAREAMPLMGAAMILFFLAALIEAFLSPSSLPYAFKATVAVLSSGMLLFYFVVLGYPRG
jgi:uncharacterized membrane protein SpoIIM required for sporulation